MSNVFKEASKQLDRYTKGVLAPEVLHEQAPKLKQQLEAEVHAYRNTMEYGAKMSKAIRKGMENAIADYLQTPEFRALVHKAINQVIKQ